MKKSTLIAIVVFAALLAGALAMLREKPERGISRLSFKDVAPDQVTRLESRSASIVKMIKDGEIWKLENGKRADAVAIERVLESIPKIESATVVTRNPERFAELEVDDEKGTTIIAAAGERELASFTVGKSARGGMHVRVDDAVYAVRGVYPSVFVREAGQWLEKKLFDVEREQVERVEVSLADGTSYAIVLREGKWTLEDPSILPDGFRFDTSQAESVANQVINARAHEVLDNDPGEEATGLGGAVDRFTLVAKDGTRKTLVLGAENEAKNVYARADGWDEVLTIFPHSSRALRKKPSEMRDLGLMSFSPNDIVALEIANGDDRTRFEKEAAGEGWKVAAPGGPAPEDFELDPRKVEQRIVALRSARALAIAPSGAAKTGLEKPTASVTVTDTAGQSATLAFGERTEHDGREAVFVRGNADDAPYLMAVFSRDSLTGGLASFAKEEGLPGGLTGLDPAALQNLPPEVRENLLRQLAQEQQKQRLLEQAGQAAGP